MVRSDGETKVTLTHDLFISPYFSRGGSSWDRRGFRQVDLITSKNRDGSDSDIVC